MNFFETEDGKLAARHLWRSLDEYFATMEPGELEALDQRLAGRRWLTREGQRREGQQVERIPCVEDCYTLKEAAPLLGKPIRVLLRLVQSRQLGAFKSKGLGNVWYIWRGTVEAELRRDDR